MSKVLSKEEFGALTPGDHVWVEEQSVEQWTVCVIYYGEQGRYQKGMYRTDSPALVAQIFSWSDANFRYWDGPPTPEERWNTPW